MTNPILEALGSTRQQTYVNPVQNNLSSNPNYQQALELIRQNNGDAKKAFFNLAKMRGIDPNLILSMIRK